MTAPALSVVVSTIGRPIALRRLLTSLEESTIAERVQLVLVDQADDRASTAVLKESTWRFSSYATTSGRGASVGRNVGLLHAEAPVVAFPDDDAWYPPATLARVADAFTDPGLTALCGRQVTADGGPSMLRWLPSATTVTRWNFLRTSITSTIFFRRSWLTSHEAFDEGMGVGSAGWYGACEESDLLLRAIEDGHRVPYDPSLMVLQDEPREHPDEAFVRKMLSYGCGQGYLWRKRRLPASLMAYYLARKVAAGVVRGARGESVLARADLAWIRGNVHGLVGVPPRELRR